MPLLSALHGFGGNHGGVPNGVQRQHHGDELAGPQPAVAIFENALQVDGAGGAVHGVVDHREAARDGAAGVVLGEDPNFQRVGRLQTADGREVLFGNAEVDEDGLHLVQDHQGDIVYFHQVAGLHQQVAGPSGDGRLDFAVAQVQPGGGGGGHVGVERGLGAIDAGVGGANCFT